MYAGVDEAGRGPVLGPLVVAGVAGPPDRIPDGVDDSKRLTPTRREQLAHRIDEAEVRVAVRRIPARTLDERMEAGEDLNQIEARAFAAVLDELAADEALVDAVGPDEEGFARLLEETTTHEVTVQARAGADAEDPLVGAASIVAKVERDAAIDEIQDGLDADIGSGYPSDPATRSFLEDWRLESPHPPAFARRTWSTLDDMGFGQARLDELGDGTGPKPAQPRFPEDPP